MSVFLITAQKVMDTLEFFKKIGKQEVEYENLEKEEAKPFKKLGNRKFCAKIKKKKLNLIAEEYDGENLLHDKEKLHF